jgi:GNAT superfamily N-acetyltransferase
MKRLFVKENYQGQGIGKALIERIIEEATIKNYKIMRLDTLDTMERALKIYFGKGFYKVDPYYSNPHNGVVYLEKELLHNHLINENSDE